MQTNVFNKFCIYLKSYIYDSSKIKYYNDEINTRKIAEDSKKKSFKSLIVVNERP